MTTTIITTTTTGTRWLTYDAVLPPPPQPSEIEYVNVEYFEAKKLAEDKDRRLALGIIDDDNNDGGGDGGVSISGDDNDNGSIGGGDNNSTNTTTTEFQVKQVLNNLLNYITNTGGVSPAGKCSVV